MPTINTCRTFDDIISHFDEHPDTVFDMDMCERVVGMILLEQRGHHRTNDSLRAMITEMIWSAQSRGALGTNILLVLHRIEAMVELYIARENVWEQTLSG